MPDDGNSHAAQPAEPAASRRPFIAGNWKLWGTRAQASEYCDRLLELLEGKPLPGVEALDDV